MFDALLYHYIKNAVLYQKGPVMQFYCKDFRDFPNYGNTGILVQLMGLLRTSNINKYFLK